MTTATNIELIEEMEQSAKIEFEEQEYAFQRKLEDRFNAYERRIKRMRKALEEAASRFEDVATIIDEGGSYTNTGFFRASARRCRLAKELSGGDKP